MPKSLRVIAALLFVTAQLFIPAAMAGEAAPSPGPASQIVAFDNEDFLGDHSHIFGNMKDLGKWGNSISSMLILSGTWEFFDDQKLHRHEHGDARAGDLCRRHEARPEE